MSEEDSRLRTKKIEKNRKEKKSNVLFMFRDFLLTFPEKTHFQKKNVYITFCK